MAENLYDICRRCIAGLSCDKHDASCWGAHDKWEQGYEAGRRSMQREMQREIDRMREPIDVALDPPEVNDG